MGGHHRLRFLARIHRWTGMDGVRIAEGGEGVTGAMIRARIWVDGRLAGGLQALLGAPMAAYSGCGEPDGGIGHGKRRSRTGLARVCGDVGLAGGSVADGLRQAGSGMARSRARARLNCSSQGQRRGRCRVNRRAERVIRPAKAKTRRLRVVAILSRSPKGRTSPASIFRPPLQNRQGTAKDGLELGYRVTRASPT